MAIELEHVSKRFKVRGGWKLALADLTLNIGRGERIALLGGASSGKSTALRIISGSEAADTGRVSRDGMLASWPVPHSSFLTAYISAAANVRFIARLYQADEDEYLRRVIEMSELGSHINERTDKLTGLQRGQLAIAMATSMDFDLFLFDENVGVGSTRYRRKCADRINALGKARSILIATTSTTVALQFCDQAYVLDEGRTVYRGDIKEACEQYGEIQRRITASQEAPG